MALTEDQDKKEPTPEIEAISLSKFFESIPPGSTQKIENFAKRHNHPNFVYIAQPTIKLHCDHKDCSGDRFYEVNETDFDNIREVGKWHTGFVNYLCKNCEVTGKIYAVAIKVDKDATNGEAYKYGEVPPFGPPTPPRMLRMIRPDKELFLIGRRAENQGMGIGAFTYYRRVVENQKNMIFDEIIKVAEKLSADSGFIDSMKEAKEEILFTKAVNAIKDGIPEMLLIDGHNPLKLLHSALSEGVHEHTDAECLEYAHSIRIVLSELAERIGQALKDEAELKDALSKLLKKKK